MFAFGKPLLKKNEKASHRPEENLSRTYTFDPLFHRFLICEFTCLLKFISDPKPKPVCCAFLGRRVKLQKISVAWPALSQLTSNNVTLSLPYLSSRAMVKCPFSDLFSVAFSFALFLLVLSPFKTTPKHGAEVLSSVPKCKKAAMCLTKKIDVLPKLCSGMSCNSVGREYNLNELTIRYI